MKNLILILSIFIFGSCQNNRYKPEVSRTTSKNYNIIIIDTCEYIEFDTGIFDQRVYSLTHKGNCKNH